MFDDSLNPEEFSIIDGMTPEEVFYFVRSVVGFKQHGVIDTDHAKILFDLELLQIGPIIDFKLKDISVQFCCVRFTTQGRKATDRMIKHLGLSAKELEETPDEFELDVLEEDLNLQFLMHDRRLRKELGASAERGQEVLKRYAIGFEEELKPKKWAGAPFA